MPCITLYWFSSNDSSNIPKILINLSCAQILPRLGSQRENKLNSKVQNQISLSLISQQPDAVSSSKKAQNPKLKSCLSNPYPTISQQPNRESLSTQLKKSKTRDKSRIFLTQVFMKAGKFIFLSNQIIIKNFKLAAKLGKGSQKVRNYRSNAGKSRKCQTGLTPRNPWATQSDLR